MCSSDLFTTPGNYVVTLTVSNSGGLSAQISQNIEVKDKTPVAAFTADKTSGFAPLLVNFDAATSSSPAGDSLTYQWDFGDGTTATGAQTSHTFSVVGNYAVTLKVTTPDGLSAQISQNIEAKEFDNTPTASFTSDQSSGVGSEEHTSELQSLTKLVCRLLLEKKK